MEYRLLGIHQLLVPITMRGSTLFDAFTGREYVVGGCMKLETFIVHMFEVRSVFEQIGTWRRLALAISEI